jgi:hypothetical protein
MSHCYTSAAVGACCGRLGPQSQLRRLERLTAASRVAAALLFLFTVPGDGTRATHLGDLGLWGRVPCPAFGGSSALVGQM